MTSVMTERVSVLLIFISIIFGCQSLFRERHKWLNATVGENISLPCIMSNHNIIQMQWLKLVEQREIKLVVVNPLHPVHYMEDDKLDVTLLKNNNTTKLHGSILHLYEVTEKDNGNYICDVTTFPAGTFKYSIKVQVTVPQISLYVTSPAGNLIEGETVSIRCVSDPPANNYRLQSLQSTLTLESQFGEFTIQNITQISSNLICQPLWNSKLQHLQSLHAIINLTVDFIGSIHCQPPKRIDVKSGENLTITCKAKSSRPLHFLWMKGNETVSNNATMNLWAVNPDQSGAYTLIVHIGNHSRLQRKKDFMVTVYNRIHTEEHVGSTTPMKTSEICVTTMTTPIGSTLSTTENAPYISTPPSAGNITTVHANVSTTHIGVIDSSTTLTNTTSESTTLSDGCCKENNVTHISELTNSESPYVHPNTSTALTSLSDGCCKEKNATHISEATSSKPPYVRPNSSTTFTSTSMSKTTLCVLTTVANVRVKEQSNITHVVFIIPFLLLLVLIGCLYIRYLRKKRMDMPPSFKPPPPPMKYTSKTHQEISMTDIL